MTDGTFPHKQDDDSSANDDMQPDLLTEMLDQLFSMGAEPYWMQDVRCAQRAIEAQRRLRASKPGPRPQDEEDSSS